MITRRKFMESSAALGAAAMLPPMAVGKTVYFECLHPVTVECYWSDKPEKFDVRLYVDLEKKEVGARYVMKGIWDPKDKGKEAIWSLPLEDVREALKHGFGKSVLQARGPWEETPQSVEVNLFIALAERPDRFCISVSSNSELYKIPDDDVRGLIRAAESA